MGSIPGGPGVDPDTIGNQSIPRECVRVSAQQCSGCAQLLRLGGAAAFSATSLALSAGGPIKKDEDIYFRKLRGFRGEFGSDGGNRRAGRQSKADVHRGLRGDRTAVSECWPKANGPELLLPTGAASGIAECFNAPHWKRFAKISGRRGWITVFRRRIFSSASTPIDDSADNTATVSIRTPRILTTCGSRSSAWRRRTLFAFAC